MKPAPRFEDCPLCTDKAVHDALIVKELERMKYALQRVKQAARTRARSETEYRQALQAARVAGLTYTAIAEAAGISKQAARQLLERQEKCPRL